MICSESREQVEENWGHALERRERHRNQYIRKTALVEQFVVKLQEASLRWFGHVLGRDNEYIGHKTLSMEMLGRRKRDGRPQIMDAVKVDVQRVGVTEQDAMNRV